MAPGDASDGPAPSVEARLLAIATDHIRRYGMERTTVVSVAREAGMSHANVYRYFRNKAALADAVTAEWLRPLEAALAAVADAPDPADDKLERLITALAGAQRDRLDQEPALFDLYVDAYEGGRPVTRRHRARVRALLERTLEEGAGAELFAIRRRDRAATLVMDLAFRFLHPSAMRLDKDVPRRLFDERAGLAAAAAIRALKVGLA